MKYKSMCVGVYLSVAKKPRFFFVSDGRIVVRKYNIKVTRSQGSKVVK